MPLRLTQDVLTATLRESHCIASGGPLWFSSVYSSLTFGQDSNRSLVVPISPQCHDRSSILGSHNHNRIHWWRPWDMVVCVEYASWVAASPVPNFFSKKNWVKKICHTTWQSLTSDFWKGSAQCTNTTHISLLVLPLQASKKQFKQKKSEKGTQLWLSSFQPVDICNLWQTKKV